MARHEVILAAAEKLFHERSFNAVGVDEIGVEAGITGGAIYRHFASKDEILVALFDQAIDELLLRLGPPLDDPQEELRHLVSVHVQFGHEHERLAGIWAREDRALLPASRRRLARRQHSYIERWRRCLDGLLPNFEPDDIVTTLRAVTTLLVSEATRIPGGRSSKRSAEILTQMALGAVEALVRSQASVNG